MTDLYTELSLDDDHKMWSLKQRHQSYQLGAGGIMVVISDGSSEKNE